MSFHQLPFIAGQAAGAAQHSIRYADLADVVERSGQSRCARVFFTVAQLNRQRFGERANAFEVDTGRLVVRLGDGGQEQHRLFVGQAQAGR